jgi:hypothetical protein
VACPSSKAAGITTDVCNHTFRGTGITAYLENGGTLEKARQMAAHASTRTTQLYDRREDCVTLDEVVKINIRRHLERRATDGRAQIERCGLLKGREFPDLKLYDLHCPKRRTGHPA